MSLNHSPSVVTSGLVFYYDANNNKKSWKGPPVTNLFPVPTPASDTTVTFPVQGEGGFYRITSGRYGGYDIAPSDVVYKYNLTNNTGCHYHGVGSGPVTSGQPYTFSFDYYADPTVTGYPNTNYLANFEGGLGGSIGDPTPSITGVWKRLTFTGTASSTTANFLLYPGACGGYLGTGGFILYKNPQVELGSFATPFVNGTRSNTQSIADLTNNHTVTANSLTYASDGTFSFNGSTDYISIPSFELRRDFTLECWAYITGDSSSLFGQGVYGTGQGLHILWNAQGTRGMIFGMYDNDLDTPSYTLTYNTWHHFVFTYSNSTYLKQFYADGILINSGVGTVYSGTGQFNIGATYSSPLGFAKGKMSSVKAYNRTLSASEVKQNFNALRGRYGI